MATTSIEEFLKNLEASGLFSEPELRSLRSHVAEMELSVDAQVLQNELINRGRLTSYQANALYEGRPERLAIGRYRIEDLIGSGGSGMVYRAKEPASGRTVALKVMPREYSEAESSRRFSAKSSLATFNHPNVVCLLESGESNGVHYFVTEFVQGRDLASLVIQAGSLSVESAINVIRQAAQGLAFAHQQKVIHRDVKPSNLLLDEKGTIKILDLGLMETKLEGPSAGHIIGAIAYMSPEQTVDMSLMDYRSDIYSLGCTLHFLLTGKSVYQGKNAIENLIAHREAPIPSLRAERTDVPEALDAVFQRMIAKAPEDRFQTMDDVIDALNEMLSKGPRSAGMVGLGDTSADVEVGEDSVRFHGTVSWDELGDESKEEERAETELKALKASRPKRGEARLRLREIVRRFPKTEAASKARRMLQRLEALADSLGTLPYDPLRHREGSTYGASMTDRAAMMPAGSDGGSNDGGGDDERDRLPDEPSAQRGDFDPEDSKKRDVVDCTVFAPPSVAPEGTALVQVFAHIPTEAKAAVEAAQEFDEDAKRRGAMLGTLIERGSQLRFEFRGDYFHTEIETEELIWQGRTASVQFVVRPKTEIAGPHVATIHISQDSVPIGKIHFKITIAPGSPQPPRIPEGDGQRYQHAFISYASDDRPEVLRRVQMLKAVGIRYFQDLFDLVPGEHWEKILYERIAESDVFFLFWSRAARKSEWVQKEWRFALDTKGDHFIHPITIERPPIPTPPRELAHLHFGDRILYFLPQQPRGFWGFFRRLWKRSSYP